MHPRAVQLLHRILAPLIHGLYRLWCLTLRIEEFGREPMDELERQGKPMVFILWHDEFFPLMALRRKLRIIAIVSRSNDGEFLARLLESLGLKTARGSSSRKGLTALLRMAQLMRNEGWHSCIAPDGPRGPRHQVKDGALFLAMRTPAHIVPIRIYMEKPFVFNSWDRFQLPRPFSRVRIVVTEPYLPAASAITPENLAQERDVLQEKLDKDSPAAHWEERQGLKYRLLRACAGFLHRLSPSTLRRLASVCSFFFWHCLPARRNEAVAAITKHLHLPEHEARRIARASFTENFLSFLEIFHVDLFHTEQSVHTLYSPETVAMLQREKAPIVVATAHLGSWELMPGLATDLVPGRKGMVIVRRQKDADLNRLMAELRGARGMQATDHRQATEVVLPHLREGGVAAFLVDHNCNRREAVFLPFLEDTAAVNVGPALLALRSRAAVFPVFLLRDGRGGHILHLMDPLHTADLTGSVAERLRVIAAFYTDAVAEMVRKYPEQWFWMHRRWKTREKKGEETPPQEDAS